MGSAPSVFLTAVKMKVKPPLSEQAHWRTPADHQTGERGDRDTMTKI